MEKSAALDVLSVQNRADFIGPLFFGSSGNQTGQISFWNSASYLATVFQAGNTTAAMTYTFPTAGPAGNNYLLGSSTAGVMSWINAPGTYAPIGSSYVVIGADATLTAERVLTAGTAISVVDGGANSTVTINNIGVTSNIAGTAISVSGATGAVTINNTGVTSAVGTSNQVNVSGATGAVTFSTPQNIHTAATPTFASETLTATSNQLILGTTRTVTITAPTPATSSRTHTIPDIGGNGTFPFLEAANIFTVTQAISAASAGTSLSLQITNSDNSNAASNASLALATGGASAGDALITFNSASTWAMGCDNSNSDNFAINVGSSLVTSPSIGIAQSSGAVSIKGTTTNDSASTGYVGEYVESNVTSATSFPSTGVIGDGTSVSLTAGDWDIMANMVATANGATVTNVQIGISTHSGNDATGLVVPTSDIYLPLPTATSNTSGNIPIFRVSINATTTYYLKVYAEYSVATPKYQVNMIARRRR